MPTLSHSSIDAASLAEFLDELRADGYSIGTNQYILAQDLLMAFVGGRPPTDWAAFPRMLAPLVSKSPRQQAEFPRRYERWWNQRISAPAEAVVAPAPSQEDRAGELDRELKAVQRGSRMGLWVTTAIVLVVLASAGWRFRPADLSSLLSPENTVTLNRAADNHPLPESIDASAHHMAALAAAVAVVVLPLAAGWWFWWRRRAKRFLQGLNLPDLTDLRLRVAVDAVEFFPLSAVERVTPALRKRIPMPSEEIAVDRTVDESLRRGGWFTPVYRPQYVTPEYLVLIERSGSGDPTIGPAELLLAEWSRRDVVLRRYHFEGSPEIVFAAKSGIEAELENSPARDAGREARRASTALFLKDLASRRGGDRLIVVADAARVTRLSLSELRSWCGHFQPWSDRILLTPPGYDDGIPQYDLLKEYFQVIPITDEGILLLARTLQGEQMPGGRSRSAINGMPEPLVTRPEIWMDTVPPSDSQIQEMVFSLRHYLGPDGFAWLCACAVYPAIDQPLTVHLGKILRNGIGSPLFSVTSLVALSRLVWFREGRMPEWMRSALIREMPMQFETEVRSALQGLLLRTLRGGVSGLELEIAQQHRHVVGRLIRSVLASLRKQAETGSPLKDRVFVSFASDRTTLRFPEAVRNVWQTGTTRGRLEPAEPAAARTRRRMVFASLIGWAVGVVGMAIAVVGKSQPAMSGALLTAVTYVGLVGLGLPLLVAGYRSKNLWVITLGVLDGWVWAPFIPFAWMAAVHPFWIWASGALLAAVIGCLHVVAAHSVRFKREPITPAPVRAYIGFCLIAAGLLVFAVATVAVVVLVNHKRDSLEAATLLAVLGAPAILASLVFVAGPTEAAPAYWFGGASVYSLYVVVLLGLLYAGSGGSAAVGTAVAAGYTVLGATLGYRALQSWKRYLKPLRK